MEANELPAPPFTNAPISRERIPRLADVDFVSLDAQLLKSRILGNLLFGVVALLISIGLAIVVHPLWMLVALVVTVICALSVLLQRIEIAHMGYAVRERDFSFRSGVISRSVATVPFARVQHVTLESGPLERRFGLATLELRTAGESVSVPGLQESVARDLKGLVVDRAGELAEAEDEPDHPNP